MKTTSISLPRTVKGCPVFYTERNKEKEKENRNTALLELTWGNYRNEEEEGRMREETGMEKGRMIEGNEQV